MIDYDLDHYIENDNRRKYSPYNFSTNAGEFVTIHYFNYGGYVDGETIKTVCDDGTEGSTNIRTTNVYVWGSHANCVHTVDLETWNLNSHSDKYESGEWIMAWSLVYSIESVTIV